MAFGLQKEQERFSLDDPEAGRKLIGNLDRHRVRLDFSELCWLFRCETVEQKSRLRAFLLNLEIDGQLVEVLRDFYCRPALTKGTAVAEGAKVSKRKPSKKKSDSGGVD